MLLVYLLLFRKLFDIHAHTYIKDEGAEEMVQGFSPAQYPPFSITVCGGWSWHPRTRAALQGPCLPASSASCIQFQTLVSAVPWLTEHCLGTTPKIQMNIPDYLGKDLLGITLSLNNKNVLELSNCWSSTTSHSGLWPLSRYIKLTRGGHSYLFFLLLSYFPFPFDFHCLGE